jgi:hypothetical protein
MVVVFPFSRSVSEGRRWGEAPDEGKITLICYKKLTLQCISNSVIEKEGFIYQLMEDGS